METQMVYFIMYLSAFILNVYFRLYGEYRLCHDGGDIFSEEIFERNEEPYMDRITRLGFLALLIMSALPILNVLYLVFYWWCTLMDDQHDYGIKRFLARIVEWFSKPVKRSHDWGTKPLNKDIKKGINLLNKRRKRK